MGIIDIVVTLPVGILSLVQDIKLSIEGYGSLPFYQGWDWVHSSWGPVSFPAADIQASPWNRFNLYFGPWSSVILALAIFALLGLTTDACAMYWQAFCAVGQLFGWTPPVREDPRAIETIEFGGREINLGLEEG